MILDLQKASLLKRFSAYILDLILLCVAAVGFGCLLSALVGYDGYSAALEESYAKYESSYGIVFEMTHEDYKAMSEAELAAYEAAYEALIADEEAMQAYNMVVNLSLVIVSLSIFLGYLLLEFMMPLLLGNGQTIGKKVFSIALMRTDGVKVTALSMFVRTVLGKYTIETMIPVLTVMLIFFGTVGLSGTVILILSAIIQVVMVFASRNHSLIHDLMACTVAVDMSSQMIFPTPEDLIAYKKRIHAENAARKEY